MEFVALIEELDARLRTRLPGYSAQSLMAPVPARDWPPGMRPDHVRQAAGLLPVFPGSAGASILLTVRAHTLDKHSGQVSLAGGAMEAGETIEQAALREAHEEIGLSPELVRCLGPLTPIDIPVSGFRLHPVVAALNARPRLEPAAGEVARILEVPVAQLMDASRIAWRTLTRQGRHFEFPAFLVEDVEIWGATAMVVSEFLSLLGWTGPDPR